MNRADEPGDTAERLHVNANLAVENGFLEARETARNEELERSLRSLIRPEMPHAEIEQRIRNRLQEEWDRLHRKRSGPSLNSR